MSSGQVILGDGDYLYAWGQGTAGYTLVFEDTGIALGGLTLFRLVPAAAAVADALIDDASGEVLIDDASGEILYEG